MKNILSSEIGFSPLYSGITRNYLKMILDFSAQTQFSCYFLLVQATDTWQINIYSSLGFSLGAKNIQNLLGRGSGKYRLNRCKIFSDQKRASPSNKHQIIGYHYILGQGEGSLWLFSFDIWCNWKLQIISFIQGN
jgi:hypothetical protein